MQPRSGFMGGIHIIADWIMKLSIVNLLWFIVNLPILVIVFFMIISPSISAMVMFGIPLILSLLLLFYPSTIAVFAIARNWVMKKEQVSLWKSFWKNFKVNYKGAFKVGFVLTTLWAVWVVDLYYFNQQHEIFTVIFTIIGILLFVYTMIFFSIHVHYDMGKKAQLKNAFFVTLGSPLLTLMILFSHLLIAYMSMRFWFVVVFFTMSVSAVVTFYFFYRFTLKVKEKAEQ
ncbi:DUF624 domain-containing protein [Bacillus shivajii]|uniref:YesL family protein n=1 Tax=Bacillus shivajii TaxID=1983719 RepID=UPI001CF9FD18|nr:DUF624 domain-containing protein [Bacillus shivajii]UCZ52483.1 DUF624 domain-containing protein [Bacillus shivajii]